MADKSVPPRTLMDNDLCITETVVYLYTYNSGNHLIKRKRGLVVLNWNTLVKFKCRSGHLFSGIFKVWSIALMKRSIRYNFFLLI